MQCQVMRLERGMGERRGGRTIELTQKVDIERSDRCESSKQQNSMHNYHWMAVA